MTVRPFFRHIAERALDLALDPRLPHAAPYTLLRRWQHAPHASAPTLGTPLSICLTFDVEHDFRDPASSGSSLRFLPRYLAWAHAEGWRGTLYVQGDLVPTLAPLLQEAQSRHELGLHGLHHEVWGRSRWWQYSLGFVSLSFREKQRRLAQALKLFEAAGLVRPRSFRAPYLNVDARSLRLLAQHGFTSDSSAATYLGARPISTRRDLWRIPVTAHPRPEGHPARARYPEFALGNLLQMSKRQRLETVAAALCLQQRQGFLLPPHIVILAHPWEFETTAGVPYASTANFERLRGVLGELSEVYELRFRSISDLAQTHSALFGKERDYWCSTAQQSAG